MIPNALSRGLMSLHDACMLFVFRILLDSRIAATIGTPNFLLAYLMVSVYSPYSGSMNASQLSSIFDHWFLVCPFLLFLLCGFTHWTKLQATNSQVWQLLELFHIVPTRSLSGLRRHLFILSVETLSIRHEVLVWDRHSLQVPHASEWVLGNS